jgi:mono/diheme cytochrome c family protein
MNHKIRLCVRLLALPLLAVSFTAAADTGEELHDANCTSCHDSSVYTREDHRVKDLDALHQQVGRCQTANSLSWSDADIEAVASYLNENYYKF